MASQDTHTTGNPTPGQQGPGKGTSIGSIFNEAALEALRREAGELGASVPTAAPILPGGVVPGAPLSSAQGVTPQGMPAPLVPPAGQNTPISSGGVPAGIPGGKPGIPGMPGGPIPNTQGTPAPQGMPAPQTPPGPPNAPMPPAGMPAGAPGAPGMPGAPQQPVSMFDPLNVPRKQLLPEDLPYANEVEAALARKPKVGARALSLGICLFLAIMIGWASVAYVDEVTHAEGQVVASQRTQSIQNLEGGILRAVVVREGQIVEAGEILARLDNEMAESSYRDAIHRTLENSAAIIRLEAELTGEPPQYPADRNAWAREVLAGMTVTADMAQQANQIIQDQMSSYNARKQQRDAELILLKSQYEQRTHDVEEQTARKRQLDRNLALAIEQRDIARNLMERGSFSRVEYLKLQQQVVALQGDIEGLAASIPRAQAAAQEAEQRIAYRSAELDTVITEEVNKRRLELASLRETLSAGGDRVTRTELRSPVRGTIVQINLNTIGGVVKPGESIMEIVPLDDTLLVEARVRPADVAFLRQGQQAMVKITAYDFSIYGGLEGTLEQISADTIEDRRGDFFYVVKVRTDETVVHYRGEELPIIPGMMATVDIMIGKKTVLNYLLKPIFKARQNALRER